ncbi:hypothetical protein DPMN_077812 [Dreissena polymorpha]|uniref:Uncharacterized protein n=1 Tax=Dreissena polymorpha TaxID=45954 RepID=A0A9D3YPZ8_DREPO|nr:hypothetical protein DPMN_077812 [Dreissena polymorpha]
MEKEVHPDLRGDQFSDIGLLLLVYETGRDEKNCSVPPTIESETNDHWRTFAVTERNTGIALKNTFIRAN